MNDEYIIVASPIEYATILGRVLDHDYRLITLADYRKMEGRRFERAWVSWSCMGLDSRLWETLCSSATMTGAEVRIGYPPDL